MSISDSTCPRLGFNIDRDLIISTPEDLIEAIVTTLVKAGMYRHQLAVDSGWEIHFVDYTGREKSIFLPKRIVRSVRLSRQRISWPSQLTVLLQSLFWGFNTDYLSDGERRIYFPKQGVDIVFAKDHKLARV